MAGFVGGAGMRKRWWVVVVILVVIVGGVGERCLWSWSWLLAGLVLVTSAG